MYYDMHKYWAKLLPESVKPFIDKYSKEDELILDPFCGSGIILIEAIRKKRRAMGVDINPIATFISEQTAVNIDLIKLQIAYNHIEKTIKTQIMDIYKTPCPKCDDDAVIIALTWEKEAICPICTRKFKVSELHGKRGRYTCPNCFHTKKINANEDLAAVKNSDRSIVKNYVLTEANTQVLLKILNGLVRKGGKNYFVNGPYGVGKSHLLAVLSNLLSNDQRSWNTFLEKDPSKLKASFETISNFPKLFVVSINAMQYLLDLKGLILNCIEQQFNITDFGEKSSLNLDDKEQIVNHFRTIYKIVEDDFDNYLQNKGIQKVEWQRLLLDESSNSLVQRIIRDYYQRLKIKPEQDESFEDLFRLAFETVTNYYDGLVLIIDDFTSYLVNEEGKGGTEQLWEDIAILMTMLDKYRDKPLWLIVAGNSSHYRSKNPDITKIMNRFEALDLTKWYNERTGMDQISPQNFISEIPVKFSYLCEKCKKGSNKRRSGRIGFDNYKITVEYFKTHMEARLSEIESMKIPYWYPENARIPEGRETNRIHRTDIKYFHQLFTNRALIGLSRIFHAINEIDDEEIRKFLKFVFSSFLVQSSKLITARKKGGFGWTMLGYWLPLRFRELNVWHYFTTRFTRVKRLKEQLFIDPFEYVPEIHNQSVLKLDDLVKPESIDYVLTGIPDADSVQFLELSALWASWFKEFNLNFEEEIIINLFRGKGDLQYNEDLKKAFKAIFQALKLGKYMTISYFSSKDNHLVSIIHTALSAGFTFHSIDLLKQKSKIQRKLTRKSIFPIGSYFVTFKKSIAKVNQRIPDKEAVETLIIEYMNEHDFLNIIETYQHNLKSGFMSKKPA